jgi:TonB-dependent Receptor Plug Domain
VFTDERGQYTISVPAGERQTLIVRRVGYQEATTDVPALGAGSVFLIDLALAPKNTTIEVVIEARKLDDGGMIREGVEALKVLPSTTGNLEAILPHIALGTSAGSGGELSSQYNVRGGNYDENLVYVNDFEIYRPQLIRAGNQEGLTFPNIDLIRDLSFSSGGFQAKYGDKFSSVMDVHYKRPEKHRGSVSASFLGASAHLEGSFKRKPESYRAFRYLVGARYKTTKALLGSLDTEGEYVPNFTDVQTYLTYDLSRSLQVGVLANFNKSLYRFKPRNRATAFGLIDFALQLRSAFEGQEVDDFTQALGGVSLTWLPERERNPIFMKLLASRWRSQENERFDILGYYILGEIEENLGSGDAGEIVNILGEGVQHTWVRNYLTTDVTNVELKGGYEVQNDRADEFLKRSHFLQWGAKMQNESILDRINEWERLDSALYSLPFDTNELRVLRVLKSRNTLNSNRFSAYFQDTYTWRKDGHREIQAIVGVRAAHWGLNNETFVTPRAQLLYRPLKGQKDISWRLATGLYYQPPFYRELRGLDGRLNTALQAQKSAHVVGGFTYDFLWGKRRPTKMRLIVEAYHKQLWDLVGYDVDNVRVRYYARNQAQGHATGLDLRLNGEFVPGAESWVNLSLLRTRESFDSIQHKIRKVGSATGTDIRNVPRPTDRLFNLSMFFQDYLRDNKNVRMHLNLTVGSGLPFGLPDNNLVYRNSYRLTPYHRVDIGSSIQLWKEEWRTKRPNHFLRWSRSTWLSLEVFNLLKVQNEASNTWIKTIYNTQYAIPNYLTGRRINLRMRVEI